MTEIEFLDIFRENLADMMGSTRMNQKDLSSKSGLAESTISRYLTGERMPTLNAFVNLCYALNCTADDLVPFYDLID